MPMLTGQQGPLQHLGVLMTKLTQVVCQPLTRRVFYHQQNWHILTQDNWVLQVIQGYRIDLTHTPYQVLQPPPIQLSKENHAMVSQEVQELLIKGAIVGTTPSPASFISQIFLIEKKGGGYRPVINLKCLNQFVRVEHFKMEGLHLLPDLIQQGDWMMKLDLKDAYLQIPIHPNHQLLLQFIWEEKHYRFQCLPFGLSAVPRVFTKLLKPVVGFLRQIGLRIIIYLDDMLFMHASKEQLAAMAPLICRLFEALGLMVNMKKSLLTPTQIIEFLGFQISSCALTLSLPPEKSRKIQLKAQTLLKCQTLPARNLAIFIGKAVATSKALQQAPLYYRALQRGLNSPQDHPQGSQEKYTNPRLL